MAYTLKNDGWGSCLPHSKRLLDTPFDEEDEAHLLLLRRLWDAVYPDADFERESTAWKDMGFQNVDPIKDLRATNLYGLHQLVFLAETQAEMLATMIETQMPRTEHNYPVAAACINVTEMMVDLLQLRVTDDVVLEQTPIFAELAVIVRREKDVDEIYVATVRYLDRCWRYHKATYMQFNEMIDGVRTRIENVIPQPDGDVAVARSVKTFRDRLNNPELRVEAGCSVM